MRARAGGPDVSGLAGWFARASGPALLAVTALLYFAVAQFVLLLNDPLNVGAVFWPAAGVTVAILLLSPTRRWAWPLAGIVVAEVVVDVSRGYPTMAIPWWTAGNVLDPLVGAWLVRRFASPRGELLPLKNLFAFIALAVIVAPLIGASVGSVGTVAHGDLGWSQVWPKYVVGDALGVLVVAPVLLTLREPPFRRGFMEWLAVGGGLVATSFAILRNWPGSLELVSPYFIIPFLIWAALRFGISGSAWFIFFVAQVMNVITAYGEGAFVDLAASPAEAVTLLQIFLLIAASSTFILAALANQLADRDQVQRLLHDLADSMPQLVWVANADGRVEYYNRRGQTYSGLGNPNVPPIRWRPSLHPDDLEDTRAAWRAAVQTGAVYECEHRVRLVDGSYRWHLSRAERVETMEGVQWYGTSTDIHDLKTADELKDQFIAIASHELRNPVGAIHGLAQQLQRARSRGRLTTERLDAYVGSLLGSTTYLARLTRDLMDVSRLQRGAMPLQQEATDLDSLIAATVSSEDWPSGWVRYVSPGDLGTVYVDPARLRQVLSNLIDNALKYSPESEPVTVQARTEGDGVLIEVVDRGIGLPPDSLDRIFEPFGRAENTGSIPGLGMGLYVAREISERHGGYLRATSPGEGQGTTLHLWLPARPPEQAG